MLHISKRPCGVVTAHRPFEKTPWNLDKTHSGIFKPQEVSETNTSFSHNHPSIGSRGRTLVNSDGTGSLLGRSTPGK